MLLLICSLPPYTTVASHCTGTDALSGTHEDAAPSDAPSQKAVCPTVLRWKHVLPSYAAEVLAGRNWTMFHITFLFLSIPGPVLFFSGFYNRLSHGRMAVTTWKPEGPKTLKQPRSGRQGVSEAGIFRNNVISHYSSWRLVISAGWTSLKICSWPNKDPSALGIGCAVWLQWEFLREEAPQYGPEAQEPWPCPSAGWTPPRWGAGFRERHQEKAEKAAP